MNILTKEAINDLLDTYASQGGDAARALAPKYGIKPGYVKKLAVKHGVRTRAIGPRSRHYKPTPRAQDPRWLWAIERGAVVA